MGTEEFWIPAVIAAVSATAEAANQRAAVERSQNAETQSIANQSLFHNQANNLVKQQTQNIATSSPEALANATTGAFVQNLRKNVGGTTGTTSTEPTNFGAPTSALGPTTGASKRYSSDTANAAAQTESYGNTYAGEQGALDAAINQRKNEALQMQTLGTNLNTLSLQSRYQSFVDQLRAQAAGVPNPWVSLFANTGEKVAGSAASNGWFTPSYQVQNGITNSGIWGINPQGGWLQGVAPITPSGGIYNPSPV